MLFSTLRAIIFTAVICLVTGSRLYAQAKLPYDSTTNTIAYNFTIDLDKPTKKQVLYNLVQDWLNQPEEFNKTNKEEPASTQTKKNENKEAVEREFSNLTPLQHTDPESDRLSGKGIVKYAGPPNGCIRLFYIQYAVIIIAEDNRLTCEIGHFKYNNYNARTYQVQPVFNWSGLMPCDGVNTMEYLVGCEACHAEFSSLYAYLNAYAGELETSLREYLKANKSVAANTDSQ